MSRSGHEFRPETVTRIDSAHAVEAERSPHIARPLAGQPVTAEVAECAFPAGESLHLHAEQLSEHLRLRLRDLDERESVMNGRLAAWETEQRANRLWLSEREREFAEREEALQRQLTELQQRARALAAEEMAAGEERQRQEQELQLRAETVAAREQRLTEQLRRLAEEVATVQSERERQLAGHAATEQEQQRQRLELRERQQYLDGVEASLHGQRRQLAEDLARVAAQNETLTQLMAAEQRFWSERKNRLATEWADALRDLAQERLRLERREEEIEQLRTEAVRLQQSASEARQIAEHLWLRLYGRASAADIATALNVPPDQAAAQFDDVLDLRSEPTDQANRLLQQLETSATSLRQHKQALETWAAQNRQQLDAREDKLIACLGISIDR